MLSGKNLILESAEGGEIMDTVGEAGGAGGREKDAVCGLCAALPSSDSPRRTVVI